MENKLSAKRVLLIAVSALVLGLILGALVFPGIANAQETAKEIKIKTSAQCEMCKDRIEKALKKADGVISSDLDLETKEVTVKYKEAETSPEAIRKVITKVGYDADDQPANEKAYNKLPKCCKKPE